MKIGMIDSGIGGLTILKKFLEVHPNNEYIYFGDTKNMPYGEKSKMELLELSRKIINFLVTQKVEMVILACGTLSSMVYEELQKEFNVQIVDIINSLIEEIKNSDMKRVLLLGTEKTIESRVFENRFLEIGIQVEKKACPKLAPIIEGKIKDDLDITIQDYLYDFKGMNIDAVIPACTHYPIIADEISEYLGISCLDIGLILTKNVKIPYGINNVDIYFSKVNDNIKDVTKAIIGDYEIKEKELS